MGPILPGHLLAPLDVVRVPVLVPDLDCDLGLDGPLQLVVKLALHETGVDDKLHLLGVVLALHELPPQAHLVAAGLRVEGLAEVKVRPVTFEFMDGEGDGLGVVGDDSEVSLERVQLLQHLVQVRIFSHGASRWRGEIGWACSSLSDNQQGAMQLTSLHCSVNCQHRRVQIGVVYLCALNRITRSGMGSTN